MNNMMFVVGTTSAVTANRGVVNTAGKAMV